MCNIKTGMCKNILTDFICTKLCARSVTRKWSCASRTASKSLVLFILSTKIPNWDSITSTCKKTIEWTYNFVILLIICQKEGVIHFCQFYFSNFRYKEIIICKFKICHAVPIFINFVVASNSKFEDPMNSYPSVKTTVPSLLLTNLSNEENVFFFLHKTMKIDTNSK